MYQPLTEWVENEGRLEAATWVKTLVPGRAMGVALKSKLLFMAAWMERIGFLQEERSILRVRTAWGIRRSHSWDGKLGSQEDSPAQR